MNGVFHLAGGHDGQREGVELLQRAEDLIGVALDPVLGVRPGAAERVAARAEPLVEQVRVDDQHGVVEETPGNALARPTIRTGTSSCPRASRWARGRRSPGRGSPGSPVSASRPDEVTERLVGERGVPEGRVHDRCRGRPRPCRRDLAGLERPRVLRARRPRDRERERLLRGGGVVDQDLDVAADEHLRLGVDRRTERADHRLTVDEGHTAPPPRRASP